MLQELHEELTPVFTALFKTSHETRSLPAVWKSAWVTPVFKKGTKCDTSNYCPVNLTCVACRLLEHVLCSHIRNHPDKYNALSPYQHGFRKKLSCESQLLMTSHALLSRLDHKDEVGVGILDFSKAFEGSASPETHAKSPSAWHRRQDLQLDLRVSVRWNAECPS